MSPTSVSLATLRAEGWLVEVVEQNIPHARTKRDLFGVLDLVGIRQGQTIGVQTTSASNIASRITKVKASPHLDALRDSGWRVVVHGVYSDGRIREVVVLPGTNAAGWPEQMELPL
jgi:hypothetical protein